MHWDTVSKITILSEPIKPFFAKFFDIFPSFSTRNHGTDRQQ